MRTWIPTQGILDSVNRTEVYCFGPWGAIIKIGEEVQLLPPSPIIQIPDYFKDTYVQGLIFSPKQETVQTEDVDS